jgi:TatD DNase family protein
MIDTHAHLDFENFDKDREEVISRFFESGGKAIVNIGVDLATSKKSIALSQKHEDIFAAVGFHPHDAGEKLSLPTADDFEEMKKIATHKKVKAIGEIGLDYFYYKGPEQIEQQKMLFEKQLKMANELKLPIVIHCREAWPNLYEIISKYKDQKFQLHCYSGLKEDTEKFLQLPNVHFSFSGNITYPKPAERAEKLSEAVRMIPLERIMLDSDSPFLAPQEFRGKRNEPSYVKYIAQKITQMKNVSAEEVEKITDKNAIEFFNLAAETD